MEKRNRGLPAEGSVAGQKTQKSPLKATARLQSRGWDKRSNLFALMANLFRPLN